MNISGFLSAVEELDIPPVFLMPHSTGVSTSDNEVVEQLLPNGIEDIVIGQPSGMNLVLALRGRLNKYRHNCSEWRRRLKENCKLRERYDEVKANIHHIIWVNLRQRKHPHIPVLDSSIPSGCPVDFRAYRCGELVGKGNLGWVYRLVGNNAASEGSDQVVKFLPKAALTSVKGLTGISQQISILEMLRKDELRHPNICVMHEVYHSHTHILLRMENGGRHHLFHCLRTRDGGSSPPLPALQVASIVDQISAAIDHLHNIAKVCHRDVKPENIIVRRAGVQHAQDIQIKLIDFDAAVIVKEEAQQVRSCCGTCPFAAPEVTSKRGYLPFPVDVWSFGIVLVEIFCGVRFLERNLGLIPTPGNSENPDIRANLKKIYDFFRVPGSVHRLLCHCRPELALFREPLAEVMSGVLRVVPTERMVIRDLRTQMLMHVLGPSLRC